MLKSNIFSILFVISQLSGIWPAATRNGFSIDPRIINGTDADLDSSRHQVSIRLRSDENKKFGSGHECGGSLISNNLVLTAAHCFLDDSGTLSFGNKNDWVVVAGNLLLSERNKDTLVFNILDYVPNRLSVAYDSDIALVVLDGTVPGNHPTVKPITLNEGAVANNTMCHATGWGLDEKGKYPNMLKSVDLPIIDFNDCREKSAYGKKVHEGMICAGYLEGGQSTCHADSGGPLVCGGIQVGIVSWSNDCALPLKPSVFTSVSSYKKWILRQVALLKVTPPKFASIL